MRSVGKVSNGITEGAIFSQLLVFFFPVLLGTLFQQLYNTVDAVIVGRFVGKAALAAVGGSSAHILNLIIGFFTGVSSGAVWTVGAGLLWLRPRALSLGCTWWKKANTQRMSPVRSTSWIIIKGTDLLIVSAFQGFFYPTWKI